MHPQVIRDGPGNCPICGMALTPVRADAGAAASTAIAVDPVTAQNMGLRVGRVGRGPLRRAVRTVAAVEYDETSLADVTVRFRGWIEKLYVGAAGQAVRRGEPLLEIYSPELYAAQTEYLLAAGDRSGAVSGLKAGALAKLASLGVAADQVAELERTGQPRRTLRIDAPRDGTIVEKMAVEGQMVDEGMRLFRIADLGRVWVMAQVYEQDLPFVSTGQEARVVFGELPGREFRGRVAFVYPTVDEKTRTVRARLEFANPDGALRPGMFATAELTAEIAPDALLVPDVAVLRSGARNTVFVSLPEGRFEPREVTLGARSADNDYQVLAGLSEGENVVISGQFMLDSESQLREAIMKLVDTASVAHGARAAETWRRTHPSAP
jgi:multidrug efflux pump subunit AcrA (membrane-fusion protein)